MPRAAIALPVLLALAVASAPGVAAAQEVDPQVKPFGGEPKDPGIVRSGTVFGVTLGWGTFAAPTCGNCSGRYFSRWFGLHLGGMIGTDFALLGGIELGMQDGRSLLDLNLILRVFLDERTWAELGFGSAIMDFSEPNEDFSVTFDGYSGHLGVGVDLAQTRSFALDAALRGVVMHTTARANDAVSRYDAALFFELGAVWY